ncbi:MAG: glycosyltransferase family 2 protein [Candidatus Omnitrophica bacterium]|nr:glycosyltransferase family 2 protein [Candidatus Omnitrophota bacterium]
MRAEPLVTVIIPTYNRSHVLKRALLSATSQTYQNIEILVVSDGSTDATEEIVKSIADPRIKYICHEKNRGLAATRNTGIKNSTGEYVTFLDDDDEWLPEKISRQIDIFKNISAIIGLIFTNGFSEYENDYIVREKIPSGIIYDPGKDKFFPLRILISPPTSWMIPKTIITEIGYFDENMYNNWDDGDYFVRLARVYPVYFLNENLAIWHALGAHVNSISPNLIKGKEIFIEKNLQLLEKDPGYLFRFYRTMGKDILGIDKLKARRYLLKAIRMKPFDLSTVSKILKTF